MCPESLPASPEVLKQLVIELYGQLDKARSEKTILEHQVQHLLRQLFGRKSEQIDPRQLTLPELATLLEGLAAPAPAPAPAPTVAEPTVRARRERKGRYRDLPRRRIEHPLTEAERVCSGCNTERQIVRWETSEQLEYMPASLLVLEHARPVAVCQHCAAAPVMAAKPAQPIDKGLPGPGLLAYVAISKFEDHLPLHRLERIFERQGLRLSRSTTCGWLEAVADLFERLVDWKRRDLLRSKVIATDDTPVPVLDPGSGKTSKGRLWTWVGDETSPWTVFDYTPTREREGPARFLGDYRGYLQADAYAGYDHIYATGRVVEVGCWMHARRYFYEAAQVDPIATEALAFIRELFLIEREVHERSASERFELRKARAKPVLDGLKSWIAARRDCTAPKTPLGQALGYASRQWQALSRYLEDGDLPIDNGRSERALRTVAIGRKNWLFAGSQDGGRRAAVIYSVIASAKRHGVDTFAYLRDLLTRLPTTPDEDLPLLLPDRWVAPAAAQAAA